MSTHLEMLITAHEAAMAEWRDADDEKWEERGKEINARVGATRQALFDHRPTGIAEVQRKAVFMAGDKAFNDWDDFDQVKLVEALTPTTLSDLCKGYDVALEAWRAELARDLEPSKEQELDDVFTALRDRIFDYRPTSIEEMVEKATFLSTRWDQAEGLNRHRIQQLLAGFGASLIEPEPEGGASCA